MTGTTDDGRSAAQAARILLVDDNTANLQVLRETLEPLGCRMLVAKSGRARYRSSKRLGPT